LIERPSRDTEAAISLLLIDFGVKAHFLSKSTGIDPRFRSRLVAQRRD
jgi:hypothetical protein